jgi:hypothetical protein
MARISAAAQQAITALLVDWWTAVNTQLCAATGASVQIGAAPVDLLMASEIGQRLVRIAAVAEALEAAEARQEALPLADELAGQMLEDCAAVEAWLNQGPVSHKTPDAFYTSPVGFMILRAKVWANEDRLITLSDAAQISGMSLSVLSQRMTRGQLPGYRDPKIKNPKHGRRVRLSDLHILINEHTDRIPFASPYLLRHPGQLPVPTIPRSS